MKKNLLLSYTKFMAFNDKVNMKIEANKKCILSTWTDRHETQ